MTTQPARVKDALSPGSLVLAVGASVVGTVLTTRLGSSGTAALVGAAISPVIAAVFTTRRKGATGRLRVVAVAALTLAALVITISGFTSVEVLTGESLAPDRPTTFIPDDQGDTGPVETDGPGDDNRPAAPQPRPDLVVTRIDGSGVTVANVGDGAAGGFVVLIRGEAFFSDGLAPGGSQHFAVNLCEGQVDVVVDPEGTVDEVDETNNTSSAPVIC